MPVVGEDDVFRELMGPSSGINQSSETNCGHPRRKKFEGAHVQLRTLMVCHAASVMVVSYPHTWHISGDSRCPSQVAPHTTMANCSRFPWDNGNLLYCVVVNEYV